MMKKTHMAVGVTVSTVAAAMIGITINPLYIIASAIGSIIPDMDHPSGAINQKLLIMHNWFFKALTYTIFAAMIVIYAEKTLNYKLIIFTIPVFIAIGFSRHRSVTHSLVGLLGMALLAQFIKTSYSINLVIPIVIGFASHIIADMFNPEGVELLWPMKKHYKVPLHVETGGIGEQVVLVLFLAASIYLSRRYIHIDVNSIIARIHLIKK